MTFTIISDIHLGCKRQSGVTPQSQQALKDYIQESFGSFLQSYDRYDPLIIAGDLFDSFEVDTRTVLECYNILADFLAQDNHLILIAGNHDYSPKGDKLSSFHLLSALLISRFGNNVQVLDQGLAEIGKGVWAIPHVSNQDVFDLELESALASASATGPNDDPWPSDEPVMSHLILHANYANKFTEQSDHSLNVSREVAEKFVKAGVTLVFAHEHQSKQDFGGKVWVMGNNWPSSTSDCLGNSHKYAHRLEGGTLSTIPTWSRAGVNGYAEVDWKDLGEYDEASKGFIRVTGRAKSTEAEAVVDAISTFRAKSQVFVVTNAVQIEGLEEMTAMGEVSVEAIKAFDVMAALMLELTPAEQDKIKGLI